jgi:sulfhydrogenase subunit gamma (sulfur reductase)
MEREKLAKTVENVYKPHLARIIRIIPMAQDHRLFQMRFEDPKIAESFTFNPGQFLMLTVYGTGEAPFSISSSPSRRGFVELCIRRIGRVTDALYRLKDNDVLGMRGPYGNGFPVELFRDSNLILVAGGLGMAPLRSLLNYVLDNRADFGKVSLYYGARTPEDLLYRDELLSLIHRGDVDCQLIVEETFKLPGHIPWDGKIGLVTDIINDIEEDISDYYVAICGPPVMYKYVIDSLLKKNIKKDRIYMSLERRMECGVGKCGHCTIGYKFTCIHGPIFTYWDAINLPEAI